jgi:uncharacterized phiE125 gp8 family phage protein
MQYEGSKIKRSVVITGPAIEPITMADIVESALKLDDITTEQHLLHIWIQAAREMVEERTGRSLITQSRRMSLDYFPRCSEFEIPYGPVQSVVITYYDENEDIQTLSSSDYYLHDDKVRIKNYWPTVYDRPGAVIVDYVAGYGSEMPDVPYPLRSAILMRLAHLYENRQSVANGSFNEVPLGEDELISQYIKVQDAFY